ncbi:hypothetical protein BCL76_101488 [Streptomyces sp. CG 926]|uniref:hypothetical protein n=1 Tax=Streptomyces sp. CG 926 TaxID=1882405 RepID=UPI000D6AA7B4|nr:hypothetical protein [Streptomyces sp. CG 926]PWK74754.1 hypothetical protein BCL76_101488 [Streptomyces sp. CG 926]
MVTPVEPEIDRALDHPDPREAVERVKDVVQRRLLAVYPSAKIVRTTFFNHTYVPDLLMTWKSGSRAAERRVYLRASSDPVLLANDVMLLEREQQPLVVPLGQVGEGPAWTRLDNIAGERQTLVLDPFGLGALPSHSATRSPVALASDAIVEGGRGIMGQDQVEQFLASVDLGVGAAREGREAPTRAALTTLGRRTTPGVAHRLSSFMAAMWQGSGRSMTDFPGEVPLRSSLDATSLSLLLSSEEIGDEDFWRRIQPLVDIKPLLDSGITSTENLQHLMRSAVGAWKAHVCMVVEGRSAGTGAGGSWRWMVDRGRLALQGPDFIAYIAGSRKDLEFPEEHEVPLLAEVRERANRHGITLTSIRMMTPNRSIGYDSPGEDVTNDPQLDGISAALGQEEGVVEALAMTPGGYALRCNFSTQTAGPPGARALLVYADLLGTALRLLRPFGEENAAVLRDLLGGGPVPSAQWSQPPLPEA